MSTLSKKSEKDLLKDLQEKQEELKSFRLGSKSVSNVKTQSLLRKDIARILTELRSRK